VRSEVIISGCCDRDVCVRCRGWADANRFCINFLHRIAMDSIAVGATCENPCRALCESHFLRVSHWDSAKGVLPSNTYGYRTD